MKKYSLVKKGAALAVAAAVTLSAGNVVLAGSRSGSFKIQQGNYVTVLKSTPIEKAGKKDSSAMFTCKYRVGANDTLNFVVINKNGNIVSKKAASFRNTNEETTKYAPYRSGTGKVGASFYFRCSMSDTSASDETDVKYVFMPKKRL